MNRENSKKFKPSYKLGFGCVSTGNGFNIHSDDDARQTLEAVWKSEVRYFDTAPLYGLGTSERRLGSFLKDKSREEFIVSSKVGRILEPRENFAPTQSIWKGEFDFGYRYDFTAEGTRRSIEASLQRLDIESLDIVFIHDLSPDNSDLKNWDDDFEVARKGAMRELAKMKDEGLIQAWGVGVNSIEPIIKTLEVAEPDIFLSASQYSLILHEEALNKVFPKVEERGISVVVGSPFSAGFLAGKERYLYGGDLPSWAVEKYNAIRKIAS